MKGRAGAKFVAEMRQSVVETVEVVSNSFLAELIPQGERKGNVVRISKEVKRAQLTCCWDWR